MKGCLQLKAQNIVQSLHQCKHCQDLWPLRWALYEGEFITKPTEAQHFCEICSTKIMPLCDGCEMCAGMIRRYKHCVKTRYFCHSCDEKMPESLKEKPFCGKATPGIWRILKVDISFVALPLSGECSDSHEGPPSSSPAFCIALFPAVVLSPWATERKSRLINLYAIS